MRGRVVGAFAVGFAIGAVCLGVALWSTGTIRTTYQPPWRRVIVTHEPASAVPDVSASAQLPSTPVPPPEQLPAPAVEDSADRAATEPVSLHPASTLHLAMPLANID